MELETIKTKITALESKVRTKQEEIKKYKTVVEIMEL